MNRFLKSAFSIAAVLAAFAVIAPAAGAQQFRDRRQSDENERKPLHHGGARPQLGKPLATIRDRSVSRLTSVPSMAFMTWIW